MTSEKLKCVFCKDRNGKIITFVQDKLKKCKEVLQIRVNFKLKYDSVQLPEQVNDTDGYHRNCYNSFTALMAKYRNLSEINFSSTVDLPSTSSSTSISNIAVDVSETVPDNTSKNLHTEINTQEIDTSYAIIEPDSVNDSDAENYVPNVQKNREKTPSPQPGPSKGVTKRRVCAPRRYINNNYSDSSSSDSSVSDESSIENSDNETEQNQNVSFSEMLETPDMTRKATTKNRKPAINSRAQVVTKNIFENSEKTCQPQPTKKGKSKESWYCKACKQDRVADMHLCSICECYLHDECVDLTKEDKEERYICPYCS
ncbi:hypothetical protein RN001_005961 [Aquatica leii]|uniref:PHD-type domain-containing protein n=1 Tax=Aquatica leii TaxID=1421715 RepID=A0AAN7PCI2_9COLE|nr:hypothetical protein RN001_005961 [Aquatica leii]